MRLVIQRILEADVSVDGETVGRSGKGLLVFCGVDENDGQEDVAYCIEKTAELRIFEDDEGKMNRSVRDISGSLLVISQFTLLGDARHGRRPSFSHAARPEKAIPLYSAYCQALRERGLPVEEGRFGADMKVRLTNDGPVTILIDSRRTF